MVFYRDGKRDSLDYYKYVPLVKYRQPIKGEIAFTVEEKKYVDSLMYLIKEKSDSISDMKNHIDGLVLLQEQIKYKSGTDQIKNMILREYATKVDSLNAVIELLKSRFN